jgi:hypothetical protein
MKKLILSGAAFVLVGALAGCATTKETDISKYGPGGLTHKPIETVDLIALLTNGQSNSTGVPEASFPAEFEKHLAAMRGELDSKTGEPVKNLKYARNRIQDRLIVASNDKCEEYKTVLKQKQSTSNFYYGMTSIIAGAAGAISNGMQAAKNLAAVSGVSTSLRSEHNQAYYADMAAHVITKGITQKRKVIADAIYCARQQEEKEYTVERAIADSIIYHGACSLIGGLETLDHVLSTLNANVGTDALSANQFFAPYIKARQKELTGETPKEASPAAAAAALPAVGSGNTEAGKQCAAPDPKTKDSYEKTGKS